MSMRGGVKKGATPLLRGRRRDWISRALNERFEPFPVSLEVGLFHLDRAGVVCQHLKELPSERSYTLLAAGGSHQVDRLQGVDPEIVELLEPHAVPDVMMARSDQGHLKPRVLAAGVRLGYKCGRFGLLGESRASVF
jgi:hypothetical protein